MKNKVKKLTAAAGVFCAAALMVSGCRDKGAVQNEVYGVQGEVYGYGEDEAVELTTDVQAEGNEQTGE